ncbi:MAG: hypothetical protein HC916_15895 [Coleofasciculaceae cyanobacterium SM2_1_6]|nr:hypothetical protein [Coleofasciculaceae cyanobacterium SM2_1_6]
MQKTVNSWFRYGWAGLLGSIALSSPFLSTNAFAHNHLANNIFADINVHEDIYRNTSTLSTQTSLALSANLLRATNAGTNNLSNDLIAQAPSINPQEIQNRLVGQWEIYGIFFVPVTVVFNAQGKGFVLIPFFGPGGNNTPTAYEFSYQIRNTGQPIQIDIAEPGEPPIQTIFEFTSDGRIRVEALGIKPGDPRPTEFTTGALFLGRVSNLTALPRNTQIANSLEVKIRQREQQGRNILGSILRSQQAYSLENEIFTTDLEALGIGLGNDDFQNYTYQLVPGSDLRRQVFVTAAAKTPRVRSFSGVAFTVDPVEGEENFPMTGICETIEPSMTPPALPTINGQEVQCAPGSRVPEDDRPPFPFLF